MLSTDPQMPVILAKVLAERIGVDRYNRWFKGRTRFSWESDGLLICVSTKICLDYIQSKFIPDIVAAANEVIGKSPSVKFAIVPEQFKDSSESANPSKQKPDVEASEKAPTSKQPGNPSPTAGLAGAVRRKSPYRRRWNTLDDFVVGPCNRVAHASATAVAEDPGADANPLVLHGPVGTGKSHLLEGICVDLRKRNPDWRVRYVTSEEFTNCFVQSMRVGTLADFRKQFRECDTLLLDDLHFLATKRATMEEFLHTFDTLYADGKQIVVSCDCHPRLDERLLPGLVDRLLGGGIWSVMPPDYDTRANLLRQKSRGKGRAPLADELVVFLADHLRGNVRELTGAVNSLYHFARVTERKMDIGMAREVLGDLLRHSIQVISLEDIDDAVCGLLKLAAKALQAKDRHWAHSHPRMIAMYLARKHTTSTYAEIGSYFGARSHSTAVAAEKKVRIWLEQDERLKFGGRQMRVRDLVERVEQQILR